jgi:hypothetical protein
VDSPDSTTGSGEQLLDALVALLRDTGEDITLDLTDEPPTVVVARTAGRIFAAAWPADGGLFVRLRLDVAPEAPSLEPVSPGSLAYESMITDRRQLTDLVGLLRDAHELARSQGPGRVSKLPSSRR